MFESDWLIPAAMLVIVVCEIYVIIRKRREKMAAASPTTDEPHKKHSVQCPQCQRWKELEPIDSNHEQVIAENPQAGAQRDQTQYSNSYKCPFCGHRWQEEYTL
jgi:DNA-directed RNA polymerase subunit RPC12/RpoP